MPYGFSGHWQAQLTITAAKISKNRDYGIPIDGDTPAFGYIRSFCLSSVCLLSAFCLQFIAAFALRYIFCNFAAFRVSDQ